MLQRIINRSWKQFAGLILLIGVDLAISLPIMGATYRPFSWMAIGPEGTSSLYPVIQNMTFVGGKPHLTVKVSTNTHCLLQRSANLSNASGWSTVAETTSAVQVIYLTDPNPGSNAVFYRVTDMLP